MASLKAAKPSGVAAQDKEPAPKLSETATKPSAAKSGGVKKAEQKPRETKRKVKSSKQAAAAKK
uniref:Uncharacterized protein n=1 Tax=Zea mays TaxID=4577 RepID=B6T2K6_MAIZE|nr:hypothetical protein [Zea mays]